MFEIEEKILERSIYDGKMGRNMKKSKSIASMRVVCEKNQEKILERSIDDVRKVKRRSESVALMMVENWGEDLRA